MTATTKQARDDILTVVKAAWDTTGYDMLYDGLAGSPPKGDNPSPWARTTVRHVTGNQATLANHDTVRRYRRTGFVTVQVFADLREQDDLCKTLLDAFEGVCTDHGVWFRNVRMIEVGSDGTLFQCNVIADFVYDEVK